MPITAHRVLVLGSSGEKTEDTVIKASAGVLGGIIILTDGTNDATAKLYDHASAASGTKLWEAKVPATDEYGGALFPFVIAFANGCYLDLTGTGASAIVYYD